MCDGSGIGDDREEAGCDGGEVGGGGGLMPSLTRMVESWERPPPPDRRNLLEFLGESLRV